MESYNLEVIVSVLTIIGFVIFRLYSLRSPDGLEQNSKIPKLDDWVDVKINKKWFPALVIKADYKNDQVKTCMSSPFCIEI